MGRSQKSPLVIYKDTPGTAPVMIPRDRADRGPLLILTGHAGLLFLATAIVIRFSPPRNLEIDAVLGAVLVLQQQTTLLMQLMIVGTRPAVERAALGGLLLMLAFSLVVATRNFERGVSMGLASVPDRVGLLLDFGLQGLLVVGPLAMARLGGGRLVRFPPQSPHCKSPPAFRWSLKESLLWVLLLSVAAAAIRWSLQREGIPHSSLSAWMKVAWCVVPWVTSLAMIVLLGRGSLWRRILAALAICAAGPLTVIVASNHRGVWANNPSSPQNWRDLVVLVPSSASIYMLLPLVTYLAVRWCGFRWVREERVMAEETA